MPALTAPTVLLRPIPPIRSRAIYRGGRGPLGAFPGAGRVVPSGPVRSAGGRGSGADGRAGRVGRPRTGPDRHAGPFGDEADQAHHEHGGRGRHGGPGGFGGPGGRGGDAAMRVLVVLAKRAQFGERPRRRDRRRPARASRLVQAAVDAGQCGARLNPPMPGEHPRHHQAGRAILSAVVDHGAARSSGPRHFTPAERAEFARCRQIREAWGRG